MKRADDGSDPGGPHRAGRVLCIVTATVVRSEPGKFGPILCQLSPGMFVRCVDEKVIEGVQWLCLTNGWIGAMDSLGYQCSKPATEAEAAPKWEADKENAKRIVGTISGLLARCHSLVNARRVARSIHKHSTEQYKPLVGLPDVGIEDLLIALSTAKSLRQAEIFEFIRIASSQQCDPIGALKFICEEILNTMSQRPTLWVKQNLPVLNTNSRQHNNDQFIMLVARGDIESCASWIQRGQDLTAIHSELKYTALHAAADFGQKAMVQFLLSTGISTNIRDSRKGQTALHYCAQSGRSEIAALLIAHGADRNLQNHRGLVPYQVADEQGHYECRELLKFPPPEIQFVAVTDFSSTSITLTWVAPVINEKIHSKVLEYLVEWSAVGNEHDKIYYKTKELKLTINNLRPSSGHCFTVYSLSLAGRSLPTSKIIHFTLPCEPDAPFPIEVVKISTNGMLLHWHHTLYDNGGKVDFYQMELVDENTCCTLYGYRGGRVSTAAVAHKAFEEKNEVDEVDVINPETDDFDGDGPFEIHDLDLENSSISSQENMSMGEISGDKNGAMSTTHRVIKHRNPNEQQKQIMGLICGRNYLVRIRCHNEFGYSNWAAWSGPVCVQAGIQVKELDFANSLVHLKWFIPILSGNRKVDCYELQVCKLKGALVKNIQLQSKQNDFFAAPKSIESEDTLLEYITVRDDLAVNEFRLVDLQPGGRYQCRVRSKIDGVWSSWNDQSMLSDIIIIPAARPDPPVNVRPAIIDSEGDEEASLELADDESESLFGGSLAASTKAIGNEISFAEDSEVRSKQKSHDSNSHANARAKVGKLQNKSRFDIHHNAIVITWTNGNSNGSPILEYNILCAKVRDYRVGDLKLASRASSRPQHEIGSVISAELSEPVLDFDDAEIRNLKWDNVTELGDFMGPQAFRVKNLIPGASYIFRVRQRNAVDWSDYSAASIVITTHPTIPPGCPGVYSTSSIYAVVKWTEYGENNNGLTNLEYDVQIAQRSLVDSDEIPGDGASSEEIEEMRLEREQFRMKHVAWTSVNVRSIPDISEFEFANLQNTTTIGVPSQATASTNREIFVLLDSLTPSTFYYIRVRVRTLAGWSTWSYCQEAFRTMSYA